MRLIDADKLIELFTPYASEDKKVVYQPRQLKIDDLKNAPTVEAVPIEWIREWYTKHSPLIGSYVAYMLLDWQAENESNI